MTQPPSVPTPPSQPDGTPVPPAFDPAAAAPKKKSGALKIVLIVLAVVLVICCGGAAAAWFVAKDDVKEVVDATNTRVVTPETLGGHNKIDDPALAGIAQELANGFKADIPEATATAAAIYGDLATEDMVMFGAISGVLADPVQELDDAITGLSGELGITNFATVEPGPLGGQAKCGDGVQDEVQMAVCVWTDKGSLGFIIMYFSTAGELKAEFVSMRGEIEKRD
ncbi:hypothetical protein [Melissospora conviva]|uniref:hypothetical protein n=1 Tax=Melissospora conviva TaxID=3388432 RepID=UPI003C16E525